MRRHNLRGRALSVLLSASILISTAASSALPALAQDETTGSEPTVQTTPAPETTAAPEETPAPEPTEAPEATPAPETETPAAEEPAEDPPAVQANQPTVKDGLAQYTVSMETAENWTMSHGGATVEIRDGRLFMQTADGNESNNPAYAWRWTTIRPPLPTAS